MLYHFWILLNFLIAYFGYYLNHLAWTQVDKQQNDKHYHGSHQLRSCKVVPTKRLTCRVVWSRPWWGADRHPPDAADRTRRHPSTLRHTAAQPDVIPSHCGTTRRHPSTLRHNQTSSLHTKSQPDVIPPHCGTTRRHPSTLNHNQASSLHTAAQPDVIPPN